LLFEESSGFYHSSLNTLDLSVIRITMNGVSLRIW